MLQVPHKKINCNFKSEIVFPFLSTRFDKHKYVDRLHPGRWRSIIQDQVDIESHACELSFSEQFIISLKSASAYGQYAKE